eukprot:403334303
MGNQLAICCEKRDKPQAQKKTIDMDSLDYKNDFYSQYVFTQSRFDDKGSPRFREGKNQSTSGTNSEPISPFHGFNEKKRDRRGGDGQGLLNSEYRLKSSGSFVDMSAKRSRKKNLDFDQHQRRNRNSLRGKVSTRDETMSDNNQDVNKHRKAKDRISDTVNFLNKKVAQLQDEQDSFKFGDTPGGEFTTPGGGFNETFNSNSQNQNLMDEENIVLFHDKSKIEKFIQELPQMQNFYYAQSGKYYVPSIMCNSPRNIREEAMIILRNCDLLQNYQIKHMKSSKLADNYKIHHFAFLDDNPINWKDQLLNDLKNFFQNDGLELIGAINDYQGFNKEATIVSGPIGKSFQLLFYKQPKYNKTHKFSFFIDIIYEDLGQKELQELINRKQLEEGEVYRTCLTVYEKPKRRKNSNTHFVDGQLEIFCHILVFEKLKEDEEKFNMVFQGNQDFDIDPSLKINEFLYQEELLQKFRVAGFLPKNNFEESLFIFSVQ